MYYYLLYDVMFSCVMCTELVGGQVLSAVTWQERSATKSGRWWGRNGRNNEKV